MRHTPIFGLDLLLCWAELSCSVQWASARNRLMINPAAEKKKVQFLCAWPLDQTAKMSGKWLQTKRWPTLKSCVKDFDPNCCYLVDTLRISPPTHPESLVLMVTESYTAKILHLQWAEKWFWESVCTWDHAQCLHKPRDSLLALITLWSPPSSCSFCMETKYGHCCATLFEQAIL